MRPLIIILTAFLLLQCQNPTQGNQQPKQIITSEDKIIIVDRTGKQWDITDAVRKYGFEPSKFQFGLGPNAIRPIIGPSFYCPGDPGYPSSSQSTIVIGASIDGINRAYPLSILISHEVADDVFGEAHVAVAY